MIDGIGFKVCGLTSLEDARFADRCGADYLGFNLYPKSPRYFSLAQFAALAPQVSPQKRMAVMVEPTMPELKAAQAAGFDFFQIHFRHDFAPESIAAWSMAVGAENLWLDNNPSQRAPQDPLGREAAKRQLYALGDDRAARQRLATSQGLTEIRTHPDWFAAKAWGETKKFFALQYFDDMRARREIWVPPLEGGLNGPPTGPGTECALGRPAAVRWDTPRRVVAIGSGRRTRTWLLRLTVRQRFVRSRGPVTSCQKCSRRCTTPFS